MSLQSFIINIIDYAKKFIAPMIFFSDSTAS